MRTPARVLLPECVSHPLLSLPLRSQTLLAAFTQGSCSIRVTSFAALVSPESGPVTVATPTWCCTPPCVCYFHCRGQLKEGRLVLAHGWRVHSPLWWEGVEGDRNVRWLVTSCLQSGSRRVLLLSLLRLLILLPDYIPSQSTALLISAFSLSVNLSGDIPADTPRGVFLW